MIGAFTIHQTRFQHLKVQVFEFIKKKPMWLHFREDQMYLDALVLIPIFFAKI
jgi:hypothetical protein